MSRESSFSKYYGYLSKSPIGSVPCLIPETTRAMEYLPQPITHKKVLDAGCGQGGWTVALRGSGYEVTAVDLDTSQFPEAVKADLHELPFEDNQFDIVFCTGAFEHCFAPFIVLSEFKRVSRNGGAILITLPTEDNIPLLEDAGHYCSMSRLQMERMYLKKLSLALQHYERVFLDPVVGEHQIFIIKVQK